MHTGRIHLPPSSPGIIRTITAGFEYNKNGTLTFRRPEMEEKYVIFNQREYSRGEAIEDGDGVRFNLHSIDEHNKDKILDELDKHDIDKELLATMKQHITHIATSIERVPEEFIMHSFYKFTEDFDIDTFENTLNALECMKNEKKKEIEFNFHQIVTMEINDDPLEIQKVIFVDKRSGKEGSYSSIKKEISKNGEHVGTNKEIPKRKGRKPK